MIDYIIASLFMFFIPGFTFINALFPGKGELDQELDTLYRVAFSIVMSVVIVILLGFLLGNLHSIMGYGSFYRSSNIWGSLLTMSVVFFILGWYRGAYQWMGKIHPIFERPSPKGSITDIDDFDLVDDMEDLVRKQHKLKKKIKESKRKGSKDNEIKDLEKDLEETVDRLKKLEKKRAEQLEEDD